jgi:hypothetical protein
MEQAKTVDIPVLVYLRCCSDNPQMYAQMAATLESECKHQLGSFGNTWRQNHGKLILTLQLPTNASPSLLPSFLQTHTARIHHSSFLQYYWASQLQKQKHCVPSIMDSERQKVHKCNHSADFVWVLADQSVPIEEMVLEHGANVLCDTMFDVRSKTAANNDYFFQTMKSTVLPLSRAMVSLKSQSIPTGFHT